MHHELVPKIADLRLSMVSLVASDSDSVPVSRCCCLCSAVCWSSGRAYRVAGFVVVLFCQILTFFFVVVGTDRTRFHYVLSCTLILRQQISICSFNSMFPLLLGLFVGKCGKGSKVTCPMVNYMMRKKEAHPGHTLSTKPATGRDMGASAARPRSSAS